MANPFAPAGTVNTTLVIAGVDAAAARSAPALPLTDRVTVPRTVLPFMNVAVIENVEKVSGSISKPNVLAGTARVIVSVVTEVYVPSTLGVADSVLGGLPQVDHPPPGTVCTVNALENVMVWVPSVMELMVVLFAAVIGISVV